MSHVDGKAHENIALPPLLGTMDLSLKRTETCQISIDSCKRTPTLTPLFFDDVDLREPMKQNL